MNDEQLIREVMENYPEASFCLTCIGWDYDKVEYDFVDEEDGSEYTLDLPKLLVGMTKLKSEIGKSINRNCWAGEFDDPCSWDSTCIDALVQCSIFGEVIYG